MPDLGPTELIIILVIVLVLFGSSRLPGLFKALGQGVREFRDASKDTTAPKDTPAEEKPKEQSEETKQE
jgi:sec-independent protein translocase protein TatA